MCMAALRDSSYILLGRKTSFFISLDILYSYMFIHSHILLL